MLRRFSALFLVFLFFVSIAGCGSDHHDRSDNAAPVADAGADQNVATGSQVSLDGSLSRDADGDLVTFTWSFASIPSGSAASLSSVTAVRPTFMADADGAYVLNLIVNDGHLDSHPATVTVVATTANSVPVANAGSGQNVATGSLVTLNGTASSDADGDSLNFFWSLLSVPIGSLSALTNADHTSPTFVADIDGIYVVSLVVDDGTAASTADLVTVTAATLNSAPIANAGPDQNVVTGRLVTLDAGGSNDADGDPLICQWTFVSIPSGSLAALSDPYASAPNFTADVPGNYVLELVVNDGTSDSSPDSVTVTSMVIAMTWISGSSGVGEDGTYGQIGVPGTDNSPGARQGNFTWIDHNGRFWLFGGVKFNPLLGTWEHFNDLWTFDKSTNEWTWRGGSDLPGQTGIYGSLGVPSSSNWPGSRTGSVSWMDPEGNFWLFGGSGYDSVGTLGMLNDMWCFDVSSKEWTWMGGSNLSNQRGMYGVQGSPDATNIPGARGSGASWVDHNGSVWLFGAHGYDINGSLGFLNDLWRCDVATGQWTWMGGSRFAGEPAHYGTKGVADPTNIPGPRSSSFTWVDGNNDLWLFGGLGYDSAGDIHYLNDLWHYATVAGQWTWKSGSSLAAQPGTYGVQGIADPNNAPGSRWGAVAWVDGNDDLWLFGGYHEDAPSSTFNFYSDFWRFDTSTGNWTWEFGLQSPNQIGTYGTQGSTDEANFPGGRYGSFFWNENHEHIWLFGGVGLDSTGAMGALNDLWRIDVP